MKIGILTIHFGVNHGSALQAYALSRYLLLCGHDPKVINYVPDRYKIWNNYLKATKGRYPLIIIFMYYPIALLKSIKPRKIFEKFLNDNVPLTICSNDMGIILHQNPDFDAFIVGSDQVWNDDYNGKNETAYYLDFLNREKSVLKLAYAASFGKENPLDTCDKSALITRMKNFDRISVREDSAKCFLDSLGIHSCHVVDPTLLLSKEQWFDFSKESTINTTEDYILVYVMDGIFENLLRNACIIAKQTCLKIYVISFGKINDNRIDKCYYKCSPKDFVKLFIHAKFVITNSFHGTVFSIVMRKPMLIVGKKKYNSRMSSLLNKLGLSDRFIEYDRVIKDSDAFTFLESYNTDDFELTLSDWIEYSKKWLSNSLLGGCNDKSK